MLPLADMSPGGGNSYLGDGLAQALSARLGRFHGLRVASRTSVASLKDHGEDLHTIAQRLGVRHILEGSVQREGDQLRVTATLIDATTGYNCGPRRTTAPGRISGDRGRRHPLDHEYAQGGADQRTGTALASSPATHLAAFDPYLRGWQSCQPGADSPTQLEEAGENFRQALAQDPGFALAYAGLCERYARGYEYTRDAALIPQAEAACARALQLDSSLSEVTAALAHLYQVSGRSVQAEKLWREALRGDPDNADNYIGLGEALDGQHRTAEAERAFRQAIEAEPTYWDSAYRAG